MTLAMHRLETPPINSYQPLHLSLKSHFCILRLYSTHLRVFFSKFLIGGGTQNDSFLSGSRDGRGTWEKIRLKPKLATSCKIRQFFCYIKHEIQLFKVLLSLKVVKFDTKMYLIFLIFQIFGDEPRLGGKPWSKNGDKCRWGGGGGLTKFLQGMKFIRVKGYLLSDMPQP